MTAHPRQQGDVVGDCSLGFVETDSFAEAERDQAFAQHLLHRLAQAEIGAQGQRGNEVGEADMCRRGVPGQTANRV